MQQLKRLISCAVSTTLWLMFQAGCNNNTVTSDPLTGNIIGKITTDNGSPAPGATVHLTPANYDPYADGTAAAIESTTTDNNGRYSFSLDTPGFFNVSSRSGNLLSFQDSVYGSDTARFEATTDTLKSAGSVSGTIRLRNGSDTRNTFILVLGTTTCTQPKDTTGAFVINNLAEGVYRIRILTTENGYGMLDTTFRILAGKNTALVDPLELPWSAIPPVGPVTASLNAAMQLVTLSWPPIDTANVKCLYVFRNTSVAANPYVTLKKTATVFVDEALGSIKEGDTVRYIIAACGKNNTTGMSGVAPIILFESMLTPAGSIPLNRAPRYSSYYELTVDNKLNVYLYGTGWVSKLDSTGTLLADYCNQCEPGRFYESGPPSFAVSNDGTIYMQDNKDSTLVRLSGNLSALASRTLVPGIFGISTIFAGGGQLFINSDPGTLWRIDSSLTVLDTIIFPVSNYRFKQIHDGKFIVISGVDNKTYFVDTASIKIVDSLDLDTIQLQYNALFLDNTSVVVQPALNGSLSHVPTWLYAFNVTGLDNGAIMFQSNEDVLFVNAEKRLIGRICGISLLYNNGYFKSDRIVNYDESRKALSIYKIKWPKQGT